MPTATILQAILQVLDAGDALVLFDATVALAKIIGSRAAGDLAAALIAEREIALPDHEPPRIALCA